jgi:hypothetical protein
MRLPHRSSFQEHHWFTGQPGPVSARTGIKALSRSSSNILDAHFLCPHDLDHARVVNHHFHRPETNAVDRVEDGLITLAAFITRLRVMKAVA